jgi:hypothetical protein
MVDPSDPKSALETFADEVQQIFNNGEQEKGEQDAKTGPIAAKQKQYMFANLAVSKLLYTIGKLDAADPFFKLAEALQDLVEGNPHPLFKVEKADKDAAAKRGRQFDTTETWRVRAKLCVGIQYLIAGSVNQEEAVNLVVRKYGIQFQNLLRPGSDLETSIPNWLKTFATDATTNEDALWTYKKGMLQIDEDKALVGGAMLQRYGAKMIEDTALLAAQVIKI